MKLKGIAGAGLLFIACQAAAIQIYRTSWLHEDAISSTGTQPSPRPGYPLHQQALDSLARWERVAQGISILSLGGFLFLILRDADEGPMILMLSTVGILALLVWWFQGVSIMDDDPPDQRPVVVQLIVLITVSLGTLLSAGAIGCTSKRRGFRFLGQVIIACDVVLYGFLLFCTDAI